MNSLSPAALPRAILFDLDGTLADTAPDLAAAVNRLRTERGLDPTPYAVLRPTASAGARGMIGAAFGLSPADEGYEARESPVAKPTIGGLGSSAVVSGSGPRRKAAIRIAAKSS